MPSRFIEVLFGVSDCSLQYRMVTVRCLLKNSWDFGFLDPTQPRVAMVRPHPLGCWT